MNTSNHPPVIARLLEAARLSPAQVEAYLERALDPGYWRALNPNLPIAGTEPLQQLEGTPLSQGEIAQTAAHFRKTGYFHTPPVLSPATVARMHQGIETLRAEGWPPVFSFVYDLFWQAAQVPSLQQLITGCFGAGYRQNARIWTHYVAPVEGQHGWAPHTDDMGGQRITLWVPVVPATLDNGCMYVIPRHLKPDTLPDTYTKINAVNKSQLSQLLQAARAIPAAPGEFVGWEQEAIHWGSYASGNTGPRISLSVELVSDAAEPVTDELPLTTPGSTPAFPERLQAISRGIFRYKYWEPVKLARYGILSKRILAATQPAGSVGIPTE